MRGKKAWLKIMEAFIAVSIIGGFLVFIYSTQVDTGIDSERVYEIEEIILSEIRNDIEMREWVLKEKKNKVRNYIEDRIPSGFDYKVKICDAGDVCGPSEYKSDMYSRSKIISADLDDYAPKKIRLFMWPKE